MKNSRLAFLTGILIALTIGATTEQILNSAYDSANSALRVNLVAGGGGGGAATSITSGTTTVTGGLDEAICYVDGTAVNCDDIDFTWDPTGQVFRMSGDMVFADSGENQTTDVRLSDSEFANQTLLVRNAADTEDAYIRVKGSTLQIPNASVTGTIEDKLVKVTTAGEAVVTATTDTAGVLGVCIAGCGTTGSATVMMVGQAACAFDSATTAGNFVTIDTSTTGNCMDAGAAVPESVSTAIVGQIMTTNAGAGTYDVLFNLPTITSVTNISGGGGGSAYTTIQDEASNLTKRRTLNFAGAGVSCADGSNKTTCTIAGGGAATPYLQWTANQAFLPATLFASQDARNTHPILDYDDTTDQCAYFGGVLPASYAGGGLDVIIQWMATSATTGATGWLAAFEAHPDDAFDLDADSFAADNSASATTASVSGELQYTTIAFTDGADMDSVLAGESFRLRICRDGDGSVVTDDMTGDAELYKVVVAE